MMRSRRNRKKSAALALPKLPSLPRPRINWQALFGFTVLAAVGATSFALGRELLELPVRELEIEGPHQRVTKLRILSAAQPAVDESLLTLNLDEVRRRIAAIDWVDTVTLQRIWPDTLKVTYEEHRAAARWGESGLLNTRGELFATDSGHAFTELPWLAGPDGSERRVAMRYLDIRDRLDSAGLVLEAIRMDARGAFEVELDGGLVVRIGREDIDGRIDRFFRFAVPELVPDFERISYIDMRYPKGFAVGWLHRETSDSELPRLATSG